MEKIFHLRPSGKDYIWGGDRLSELFGKQLNLSPLAETWECSTHPAGPSYIVGGEFDGKTLSELLASRPELLGSHPEELMAKRGCTTPDIPILIKFIDAKANLSVQVHPDDKYAYEHENGQQGKTEMWYVVDALPGASLVYGLKSEISADQLRESIASNTLCEHLNSVPVRRGDVFFIEAGTIHAIGAGALIAEIQQNSNLTYRLYDYGRLDKQGNARELHIDKSLAVSKLTKAGDWRRERPIKQESGYTREKLCECEYFAVEKLCLDSAAASYAVDSESFRVLLCIEGSGRVGSEAFKAGDCVFVGAGDEILSLEGKAQLLSVKC